LIGALKHAVSHGHVVSASAFVEAAILEKLARERRGVLHTAYAEAAGDARFLADLRATARALAAADNDGLRRDRQR